MSNYPWGAENNTDAPYNDNGMMPCERCSEEIHEDRSHYIDGKLVCEYCLKKIEDEKEVQHREEAEAEDSSPVN
jgi:formylmethanofuran dehydrogenase subunit E